MRPTGRRTARGTAPPAGSPATPLSPGAPAASGVAAAKRHEDARVRSAIQTDFILSAEIMALTLASLTTDSVVAQAVILAVVGLGLTALVYGGVALIVKADDVAVALAANPRPVTLTATWAVSVLLVILGGLHLV